MLRSISFAVFAAAAAIAAGFLSACPETPGPEQGGGGQGGSDAGADCPSGPQAMFDLTITAQSGPVPYDVTLDVSWSAAQEPTFSLQDPMTWGSLAEGAN